MASTKLYVAPSVSSGIPVITLEGELAEGYCVGDVLAEMIGAVDHLTLSGVLADMAIEVTR